MNKGTISAYLDSTFEGGINDNQDLPARQHGQKYKVYHACARRSEGVQRMYLVQKIPFSDDQPSHTM